MSNHQVGTPHTNTARMFLDIRTENEEDFAAVDEITPAMIKQIVDYACYIVINGEDKIKVEPRGASVHNHPTYDGEYRCDFCNYHKDEVHSHYE